MILNDGDVTKKLPGKIMKYMFLQIVYYSKSSYSLSIDFYRIYILLLQFQFILSYLHECLIFFQ